MFQEQRRRQVEGDFAMPSMCLNCIESHDGAREYWKTATLVVAPAAAAADKRAS